MCDLSDTISKSISLSISLSPLAKTERFSNWNCVMRFEIVSQRGSGGIRFDGNFKIHRHVMRNAQ